MSDTPLADYFRAQADWRDTKAETYPEDKRNAQSAEALRSLAEFVASDETEAVRAVRALEPHLFAPHEEVDPVVGVVTVVGALCEEEVEAITQGVMPADGIRLGGDQTARAVVRYGYGYSVTGGSHVELLTELVELCSADAYRYTEEHGEDRTGTLAEFEVEAARDGVELGPQYFRPRSKSLEPELEGWVQEAREAGKGGDA